MKVGLVGAGAMGTALGAGWIAGGTQVITCIAGRSQRTRALATQSGIELVDSLDDVVRCDIVVSIVPPAQAISAAEDVAATAARTGATPLVVDLNAVAPSTLSTIADLLADVGLTLIDGSISGGPPTAQRHPRVYVCGPHVTGFLALPSPWLDVVALDGPLGAASALKMCTASVYKGTNALIMQAMLTAHRHGVLTPFLDDTARAWPADVPHWHTDIALAASKAVRYVDEMHEIAQTQSTADLPRALFDGVAAAYERAASTPLGHTDPEQVDRSASVAAVLDRLARPETPTPGLPAAVLFDFSGTLFHIESAEQALLAALGPDFVSWAEELVRWGAINGSSPSADLPAELAEVWAQRDLSPAAHRAAYSGAAIHAGLDAEQARRLYDRGLEPDAWHPYPDTVRTLRRLHDAGVPVAMISNIGWDPRPILARYGVDRDVKVLVLSDERGVIKPDPEIFRQACAELGIAPAECLMVGDNRHADGGATAVGMRFELVDADPASRRPDALLRAVGLQR